MSKLDKLIEFHTLMDHCDTAAALKLFRDSIEALTIIATYPPVGGRRTEDGYPSEVVYDEYAYKRIIDSYRRVANTALADLWAAGLIEQKENV